MIKKWNQFILEMKNNGGIIDTKMQEIKDLIDTISNGQNMIYEWENKDDHQLMVSFTSGELSIKYEFDIDDLYLTKIAGESVDFSTGVDSIEAGMNMIEDDIKSILNL